MSKFRKMTAVMLSVIMLVCMFCVPAGAESISDTAKAITSGKSYSITLEKTGSKADFSIKTSKKGKVIISLSTKIANVYVRIYDENGNKYIPDTRDVTAGDATTGRFDGYSTCKWNPTVEKFSGTLTYEDMNKGTYYIRFEKGSSRGGNGKATFSITYPSSEKESSSKLTSIAIPMKVGETLQLSTDAGDSGIKWSSSKSSVASVSSDGKVTAKKAGTADITAALGDSKVKIQIKVTK